MEYDKHGNQLIFVVYDRSKKGTTTGFWCVAVFKSSINAQQFLDEKRNEHYFISCNIANKKYLSLARD